MPHPRVISLAAAKTPGCLRSNPRIRPYGLDFAWASEPWLGLPCDQTPVCVYWTKIRHGRTSTKDFWAGLVRIAQHLKPIGHNLPIRAREFRQDEPECRDWGLELRAAGLPLKWQASWSLPAVALMRAMRPIAVEGLFLQSPSRKCCLRQIERARHQQSNTSNAPLAGSGT